jgi:hypothetical protein
MRTQLHLMILMLGCLFPQAGECANIIWVADMFDESGDGIQDDQTWVDILYVCILQRCNLIELAFSLRDFDSFAHVTDYVVDLTLGEV